jgi:hypothetical protein
MKKQHYDRLSDFDGRLSEKSGVVYQYSNRFSFILNLKNHPSTAIAIPEDYVIAVED